MRTGGTRGFVVGLALVAAVAVMGVALAFGPGRATSIAPGGTGTATSNTASPSSSTAPLGLVSVAPSPTATGFLGSAGPDQTAGSRTVPLAVASGFNDYAVTSVTRRTLASRLAGGTLIVPCGAEAAVARALGSAATAAGTCVPADQITARLDPASTRLALIPPALVTPRVKVIALEGADLFGEKPARTVAYPLVIPTPAAWPAAWSAWSGTDVRVIVTTGVNCPDRGVSHQTVVLGKGWDWLFKGGTARYTGTHWDPAFGWYVVDAVRTDHAGALRALIRNADVAVSDFECAMTRNFVQHDSGTVFTIDPRVAAAMAKGGFDVATVAADHTTNAGLGPVGETVDLFRASGIQPTGAGRNLRDALRPAIVDAGGIRFGFIGFDAIGGSTYATATSAGVAHLTAANVKAAVARARALGAQVIIALPQWSSTEYRARFTPFQLGVVKTLVAAGVDHIVGADFHWAGALSISLTGSTYRYVGSSQGNFFFDQDWSRQTEEGIVTSLTFVGRRLAQVRLTPIVVLDHGQPNLTDPASDGQFVLRQVLAGTTLPRR